LKKYKIIYVDPPWEYKQSGSKKNSRGMAKQHYNTMSTEDICDLKVRDYCDDDSILFMWATFPNLDQALKVIQAWDFIYMNAAFMWVKKNKKSDTNFWGMGAYTRANAELCLLAISKKTKASVLVKDHGVHQIIESPIMKHSEKPPETRDKIIQLCGNISRLELFSRQKIEGWDSWGNEIENDIEL